MVHKIKFFLFGLFIALSFGALAAVFNQFTPANGILKGSSTSYITTSATAVDVIGLWQGPCNSGNFLAGDGTCQSAGGGGGGSLTVSDGLTTVTAVTNLNVPTGILDPTSTTPTANLLIPIVSPTPNSIGGSIGDCVSFTDGDTGIGDNQQIDGFHGPCVISDAGGHPIINLNAGPSITGTGCSDARVSQDNSGAVTTVGIGGHTCTITFGNTFSVNVPNCVVSGYSAGVLPFISTAPTATSFQVTVAAAGTFSYICL